MTKDYQQEKDSLLAQLRDCLDDDQALEIQKKIVQLNREERQAKEERENNIAKLFTDLVKNEVSFDELMGAQVYSPQVVLDYLQQHRLIPSYASSSAQSHAGRASDKEGKADKKSLIVGTFSLADYGFEMPKNAKGQPMSDATEFVWDWNKRYGGLSWENKFIRLLAEKGYRHAFEKATPAFKLWLNDYKEGQKRAAGKKIYENKREFLKTFGMKPADADKIDLSFEVPEEEVIRESDEHAQIHPDEQQDQGAKRKSKKAATA